MSRWSHVVAVALCVSLCAVVTAAGCSASVADAPRADGDASVRDSGRPKGPGGASDASADAPAVAPTGKDIPEGWTLYTDYDPACGIYVPSAPTYLPEPFRWEPCSVLDKGDGIPGPDSINCKRMVTDWTVASGGAKLIVGTPAEVIDGRARLQVTRIVVDLASLVVADADGPVRSAFLSTGKCGVAPNSMRHGKAIYRIYEDARKDLMLGGAIGGSVDSLWPEVFFPKGHRPSNSTSQQYAIGANHFIEELGGNNGVYSIASKSQVAKIPVAPEDAGMVYAGYHFNGDDAFWVGDSGTRSAVKVWTLGGGTKTLVGWPGDVTRVAAAFGTDGTDMAWIEASTPVRSGVYANYDVWTAKYATDPGVVAQTKRHLLRDELKSFAEEFVVGCGYAAIGIRPDVDWGLTYGFRVVRLSDGVSWVVQNESLAQHAGLVIQRPLAVTCDEVFAKGRYSHKEDQVVRIRIDSLGPGTPPQ
jgi:hypothetical protein